MLDKDVVSEGHDQLRIAAPMKESEFKELCSQCLHDTKLIMNGVIGSRVVVSVDCRTEGGELLVGRIIVEVFDYMNGRPAVRVIGSDFAPIPVMVGLYLPTKSLWWPSLNEKLPPHVQVIQTRLWDCLRRACNDGSNGPVRQRQRMCRQYPQPLHPQTQLVEEVPVLDTGFEISSFDQSLAVPLRGIHLVEKPRYWKGLNLFWVSVGDRGKAYFLREATLDGRKLRLVYADDDHVLAPILDQHEAVRVDISDVLKETSSKRVPIGNLFDIREAQKEVTQYLRSALPSIGYKAKS